MAAFAQGPERCHGFRYARVLVGDILNGFSSLVPSDGSTADYVYERDVVAKLRPPIFIGNTTAAQRVLEGRVKD